MSTRNLSNMFHVIEQDGCKIILLRGAPNPANSPGTLEIAPTSREVAPSSCADPDFLLRTMRELAAARATILRIQRETEELRKGMLAINSSLQPDSLLSSV